MTVITTWEKNGFRAPPEPFSSRGGEIIMRAYSEDVRNPFGTSTNRLGSCFFVPACGFSDGPIRGFSIDYKNWTGSFLEEHLNAWVWGNSYDRLAGFSIIKTGINYDIGFIGQDTMYDLRKTKEYEKSKYAIGKNIPWPTESGRNYFRQVNLITKEKYEDILSTIYDAPIKDPIKTISVKNH